jgi:phage terminase Nu1 subunit (DNA packaging protein)
MISKGTLPKSGTLDEYRVAYIRHLRKRAAGHISADGSLDVTAEKARLTKEQADRVAMENAEARGELLRGEDVEAFTVPLLSGVAQRLLAMPDKAAPEAHSAETIQACAEAIRSHQRDALAEVTDALAAGVGQRIAAEATARRRRARERVAAAEPADGARVGRGEAADPGGDEPGAGQVAKQAVPA